MSLSHLMSSLPLSPGTSPEAKAATRKMLDNEIAYLQNSIQTHQKNIADLQKSASTPSIGKNVPSMIAHEQRGIDLANRAIQVLHDLEQYYKSRGWL